MRSISLYVHVPFCRRRCRYCTFYHVPLGDGRRESALTDSLVREFESVAAEIGEPFEIPTVYIGGGTPSAIGSAALRRILDTFSPNLALAGAEITIEMNPEDVDERLLTDAVAAGVNRASLGIQSMSPKAQEILGRCPPAVNREALDLVAGRFENYNVDVLVGVPGAEAGDLEKTLRALGRYGPPHYSVYCLEPGGDIDEPVSGFFSNVDPDRSAQEYLRACEILGAEGYVHYEVSNFARQGRECAHNLVYWRGAEYVGIGPGAHSFVGGERFHNSPSLDAYIGGAAGHPRGVRRRDERGREQRALEELMLGLRTSRGVELEGIGALRGEIDDLIAEGLAEPSVDRLRLTDRGFLVLNEIVRRLGRSD